MKTTEYTPTPYGLMERWHFDNKKLVVETVQHSDTEIVDQNRKFQNSGLDGYTASRNMKHLATIPLVVYHAWLKESGLAPGSREFANFLARKLNDSEFSGFRTGGGRVGIK